MFKDYKIRQGSSLELEVRQGDSESISATIILKHQELALTISATEDYVDGVAIITFDGMDTAEIGVYDYQLNENYDDKDPFKYPAPDCEDCEFPTVTICESLDSEESS